ncbi:MAG: HIRAN domain-containing protein [Pseudomonadota bacterium]
MTSPSRKKIFDIVGESFDAKDGTPRQHLLLRVDPGDAVTLERQPENPHDPSAVAVLWDGLDIGFLSKEDARSLAPHLDAGRQHKAQVHELKGGIKGYTSYGAKITITWDGKPLPDFKPLDEDQERARRGKVAAMKRKRDASGAFAASGMADHRKSGCLGVSVGMTLLGSFAIYSFT